MENFLRELELQYGSFRRRFARGYLFNPPCGENLFSVRWKGTGGGHDVVDDVRAVAVHRCSFPTVVLRCGAGGGEARAAGESKASGE